MFPHLSVEQIITTSKAVGYVGGAVAVIYGGLRWVMKIFKKLSSMDDGIKSLIETYLPEIKTTLNAHGESLNTLSSSVRDLNTKAEGMEQRLEDTKTGVRVLGESFLRHVEGSMAKEVKKKIRRP